MLTKKRIYHKKYLTYLFKLPRNIVQVMIKRIMPCEAGPLIKIFGECRRDKDYRSSRLEIVEVMSREYIVVLLTESS